jgi:hypothetical protein
MIRKLFAVALFGLVALTGVAVFSDVKAEAFYLTLDNLYDEGQFDDYGGATATPTGWESVYEDNKIENHDWASSSFSDVTYACTSMTEDITNGYNLNYKLSTASGTWCFEYSNNYGENPEYELLEDNKYFIQYDTKLNNNSYINSIKIRVNNYDKSTFTSVGLWLPYTDSSFNDWKTVYTAFETPSNFENGDNADMVLYYERRTSDIRDYYIYMDNAYYYNLTEIQLENVSSSKFSEGLENQLTGTLQGGEWWESEEYGLDVDMVGLRFQDSSYNKFWYDLSDDVDEGDLVYISFNGSGDSEEVCFNDYCYDPEQEYRHYSFITEADEDFHLSIHNFNADEAQTNAFFDDIMVFNLTDLFGEGEEPLLTSFESSYLDKSPSWFTDYNVIVDDIYIANQGDLEIGTIDKADYLTDYYYMYMAYQQEYESFNIIASEGSQAVIENCTAEILFYGEWFDLNADTTSCELDSNSVNYDLMLTLLQDGTVKSDLDNDSYLRIRHDNTDHLERNTNLNVTFEETIQYVRTIAVGFADSTSLNDYDRLSFWFYYRGFLVGMNEEIIASEDADIWEDKVIVLNIYNTIMRFDEVVITFTQWNAQEENDLALTELAFLKDTLVTEPIQNTDLYSESEYLLDFEIEPESCGNLQIGCHMKNATLWLIFDSAIAEFMWDKYGDVWGPTASAYQTQANIVNTIDTTGGTIGLVSIIGFVSAMLTLMLYNFISKIFK